MYNSFYSIILNKRYKIQVSTYEHEGNSLDRIIISISEIIRFSYKAHIMLSITFILQDAFLTILMICALTMQRNLSYGQHVASMSSVPSRNRRYSVRIKIRYHFYQINTEKYITSLHFCFLKYSIFLENRYGNKYLNICYSSKYLFTVFTLLYHSA